MLGVVDDIQQDLLFENELGTCLAVNESILYELVAQVELIAAHDALFILHDWSRLELEGKRHHCEPSVICEPFSHVVLLLVEYDELVVSARQNYINIQLAFRCLGGLNAGVVVEAG